MSQRPRDSGLLSKPRLFAPNPCVSLSRLALAFSCVLAEPALAAVWMEAAGPTAQVKCQHLIGFCVCRRRRRRSVLQLLVFRDGSVSGDAWRSSSSNPAHLSGATVHPTMPKIVSLE